MRRFLMASLFAVELVVLATFLTLITTQVCTPGHSSEIPRLDTWSRGELPTQENVKRHSETYGPMMPQLPEIPLEHTAALSQWDQIEEPAALPSPSGAAVSAGAQQPGGVVALPLQAPPGCPVEVLEAFEGSDVAGACLISYCETGGTWNPLSVGDQGGVSKGLFQINTGWVGPYGPFGWASYLGVAPDDLLDPVVNARGARVIYEYSGQRWGVHWVNCSRLNGLS